MGEFCQKTVLEKLLRKEGRVLRKAKSCFRKLSRLPKACKGTNWRQILLCWVFLRGQTK